MSSKNTTENEDTLTLSREQIRNDVVVHLKAKGGANFKSLNGKDLEFSFSAYDGIFFDNQIQRKLESIDAALEFYVKPRTTGPGGTTGFSVRKESKVFYIEVAPNILAAKRSSSGSPDRLDRLMLVLEQQIIRLLMLLYLDKTSGTSDLQIYGPNGKLFQCLSKVYFGRIHLDDLDLAISSTPSPKREISKRSKISSSAKTPRVGYEYWSNSCYIDSLLMVLFENVSPFWRRNMFNVRIDDIDYTLGGRISLTEEKLDSIKEHAEKVQNQLLEDYHSLHVTSASEPIMCKNLRMLLKEVLPELKKLGRWVMFNTGALYEALTVVFPTLLIDVPVQIHRASLAAGVVEPVEYRKEALFTFWDFMDPLTDRDENSDYKEIRWDLCESPVLVFTNGGVPRIKNFNVAGKEHVEFYIEGEEHSFDVVKKRSFGMFIIGDRYELVGVVVLNGVSEKEEGGKHYTSYFKGRRGASVAWYEYDDLGPSVVEIDALPKTGVWVEQDGQMPAMYFYRRVDREIKGDVKIPTPVPLVPDVVGVVEKKNVKIKRVERYDGFTIFFVEDLTASRRLISELKKVEIGPGEAFTVMSPTVLFWRVTTDRADKFEKRILELGKIRKEDL